MSAIRKELEKQIGDLSAGQTELEERLDKQQKNVASIVEKSRNLREEFVAQLPAVEAASRRVPGASTITVKPPKFDGTTWAVFHRQFDAAGMQNKWMPSEKVVHPLSISHGKAAHKHNNAPTEATKEDIVVTTGPFW